jgi:hypothetical protein
MVFVSRRSKKDATDERADATVLPPPPPALFPRTPSQEHGNERRSMERKEGEENLYVRLV